MLPKWWLSRPTETPASVAIRRTEMPAWPSRARQRRAAAISRSRRSSGSARRNFRVSVLTGILGFDARLASLVERTFNFHCRGRRWIDFQRLWGEGKVMARDISFSVRGNNGEDL